MADIPMYKGFERDMSCRGMLYEAGKRYTCEGEVQARQNGLHSCSNPLYVFNCYPPVHDTRFARVKVSGKQDTSEGITASECLEVVEEVSLKTLIKDAVLMQEYEGKDKRKNACGVDAKFAHSTDCEAAVALDGETGCAWLECANSVACVNGAFSGALCEEYGSLAVVNGENSVAIAEDSESVALVHGYLSKATCARHTSVALVSGNGCEATSDGEDSVALVLGGIGKATAKSLNSVACVQGSASKAVSEGSCSMAVANGNGSKAFSERSHSVSVAKGEVADSACSRADSVSVSYGHCAKACVLDAESVALSVGVHARAQTGVNAVGSLAVAYGRNAVAKGVKGSYLVLTDIREETDSGGFSHEILHDVRAVFVDGETIRDGVYYRLVNGEVVEAEDMRHFS